MKSIVTTRTIDIPVGVRFKIKSRKIQITGPRGKLVRDFKHVLVDLKSDTTKKKILLKVWFGNKKRLSGLSTVTSHIFNLILGVTV